MKTVVIATYKMESLKLLWDRYPGTILPLLDRPFIQHVIEYLVRQSITDFDIVLSHGPEKVESFLGDGKRWGVSFRYHLAKNHRRPYRLLCANALADQSAPLLLVHADRLPRLPADTFPPSLMPGTPVLYCWNDGAAEDNSPPAAWSGWGWLPPGCLDRLCPNADENGLFRHLTSLPDAQARTIIVPRPLSVRTPADLLRAQRSALTERAPDLMIAGREVEKNIWLSRNVVLHPTATLTPPVFIGANTRIEKAVTIGPGAVVGSDCVIDEKSVIQNSVVFAGSYVGEDLELTDVIIDKNCLVNAAMGSETDVSETFLLGSLSKEPGAFGGGRLVSRLIAAAGAIVFAPLLLCLWAYLSCKGANRPQMKKTVVRLPASPAPSLWKTFELPGFRNRSETPGAEPVPSIGWRHFFMDFLPALINVAKGHLGFVGLPPRSKDEIFQMPEDWRALYLKSKGGIVTEAMIHFGPAATPEDLYAAEAVYAVSRSWWYDTKLITAYFLRLLGRSSVSERLKNG